MISAGDVRLPAGQTTVINGVSFMCRPQVVNDPKINVSCFAAIQTLADRARAAATKGALPSLSNGDDKIVDNKHVTRFMTGSPIATTLRPDQILKKLKVTFGESNMTERSGSEANFSADHIARLLTSGVQIMACVHTTTTAVDGDGSEQIFDTTCREVTALSAAPKAAKPSKPGAKPACPPK